MSSRYMIRVRVTVLFFALLSLAVAGLSSVIVRFAVTLRDRARSDDVDTVDGLWDYQFQSLQSKILISTVFLAVATGALAIYGAAIAFYPGWLQEHESILFPFIASHIFIAFIMVGIGSFVADYVHGFQTSFDKFSAPDKIPYYSVMYYGGVAQAAYGSVLILLATTVVVLDHYQNKTEHITVGALAIEPATHDDGKSVV